MTKPDAPQYALYTAIIDILIAYYSHAAHTSHKQAVEKMKRCAVRALKKSTKSTRVALSLIIAASDPLAVLEAASRELAGSHDDVLDKQT